MQLDVHGTRKKVERATQAITENTKLPDVEKKHILKFDEFLTAKGFTEKRRLVYLRALPRIRCLLGKNFRAASKDDMINLMSKLEKSDLEEWTKHTYRVCTKKFFHWLYGLEDEYPSQVAWIQRFLTQR